MLNRAIKCLPKPTQLLATPSRSASRFTRARHPPTKHVASSSKSIHPPSPSLPAETTNPSTATEQPPSPPPSPESTELSILGPPISRIPVQVPHDSQGVLDLAKGDWSIKVKELLSQPAIVVARQIEFMNIFLGFEQANRVRLLSLLALYPSLTRLMSAVSTPLAGRQFARLFARGGSWNHRYSQGRLLSLEIP